MLFIQRFAKSLLLRFLGIRNPGIVRQVRRRCLPAEISTVSQQTKHRDIGDCFAVDSGSVSAIFEFGLRRKHHNLYDLAAGD